MTAGRPTRRASHPAPTAPSSRTPISRMGPAVWSMPGWYRPGRPRRQRVQPAAHGLGVADQLLVEERLALALADRDHLVALGEDRLRPERRRDPSRITAKSEQPSGIVEILRRLADRRRAGLEVRLDQLQLALAEGREMEQLVDRDVLLDRAEDHPGRADQLVDAEVLEQRLVRRVVDPGDRPRDVEVVLRHLADHEVVLVVAGHRGHDVGPVGAGLGQVLALAAVVRR